MVGLLDRFKRVNRIQTVSQYKMITDEGNGYYAWNGNLYQSDIIRAAIRPKVRAFGKTVAKHLRNGPEGLKVNPDVYMKFLLEEPNPYMTGQMLQEKLITHLELNNNAFAYINRDDNGYPMEIYPITATSAEAVKNDNGELFIRFTLRNGSTVVFRYTDIIHLRKDFNDNEIFGDSPAPALTQLMEVITTTDQGIIKSIKNSTVIKWLLKFNQNVRPEDLKKATKQFTDDYLNIDAENGGAAAIDSKLDAEQVTANEVATNEKQMVETVKRVYHFFNTNEKIVSSNYSENEWIAYYESSIEPDVLQTSGEYSRKLFSRRERGHGNKIIFESANLSFASMQTKLNLVQFVDRGVMSPNEVREVLNMAPAPDGDTFIRRLDTAPTTESNA